jgi:hypothetical protein
LKGDKDLLGTKKIVNLGIFTRQQKAKYQDLCNWSFKKPSTLLVRMDSRAVHAA